MFQEVIVIVAPKGLLCRESKNRCSSVRPLLSVRPVTSGPQIGTPKYVNLRREKLFNWSKTVKKRVLVTFLDPVIM